ncbi:hypothetical protein BAE44_0000186 [Dichanthelium oligosanthes]|uniref:Uncharacterized protein n=1 Tax=Dichanthelium oligosanthes TaxID=888268 RepID=A0A1E5WN17_9POAL|nr:hypothetical protein BAE44_0000186 [Dichanthelium oligosanthes]
MANPHFTTQIIHPNTDTSTVSPRDWTIPDVNGSLVYSEASGEETSDVKVPMGRADHTIHRQRVTPGHRHSHLTRRNSHFEATIGTKANGHDDDKYNEPSPATQAQPSVVTNGK